MTNKSHIVDAPSLEVFKAKVGGALVNLIQWVLSQGLELDALQGPFQLK